MTNIITYLEKILDKLADLLLPKENLVKDLEQLGPSELYTKLSPANNLDLEEDPTLPMKALFSYRQPLCKQAIWEIKFRGNKKLIHDFSLLLYGFIIDELEDLRSFHNFQNIILVPIPSSKSRQRERGFNQCILLAEELIKIDREHQANNFTLVKDILIKNEETAHQSRTKHRRQRFENLKGCFLINKKYQNLENLSFIIIDDVITTGATMGEAIKTLKKSDAKKILGMALAH
ncbi:MAG: phosphoribosyltransferase family protein [Candidatus Paceibacterota bacterium]